MTLHHVKQVGRQYLQTVLGPILSKNQPGTVRHLLWGETVVPADYGEEALGPVVAEAIIKLRSSLQLLHSYTMEEPYLAWLDTTLNRISCWDFVVDSNPSHHEGRLRELVVTDPYRFSHPTIPTSYAVLNWSIYDSSQVHNQDRFLEECQAWQDKGIAFKTFSDFLLVVGFRWSAKDFLAYWLELGALAKTLVGQQPPTSPTRPPTAPTALPTSPVTTRVMTRLQKTKQAREAREANQTKVATDSGQSANIPDQKPKRWGKMEQEAARALLMLSCY